MDSKGFYLKRCLQVLKHEDFRVSFKEFRSCCGGHGKWVLSLLTTFIWRWAETGGGGGAEGRVVHGEIGFNLELCEWFAICPSSLSQPRINNVPRQNVPEQAQLWTQQQRHLQDLCVSFASLLPLSFNGFNWSSAERQTILGKKKLAGPSVQGVFFFHSSIPLLLQHLSPGGREKTHWHRHE